MTDRDTASDGDDVRTLQELIAARIDERGWSHRDLELRTESVVRHQSWGKYARGQLVGFPAPASLVAMATALEVDVTTVILAAARTLNLPVHRRGPQLAALLPAGTDLLSDRVRDGLLAIIRACVAEAVAVGQDEDDGASSGSTTAPSGVYEWPEGGGATPRRNARRRTVDPSG